MSKILEVNNLTKIYDKNNRGIHSLNFHVNSGDFHAFIGENGSGKTTTIKSIIGAYYKYDGEILIDGLSNKNPQSKSLIGYVPESAIFPKELTVYEYLKCFALLSNLESEKVESKIDSLLKKFGISQLKKQKPYNFSSGQKKKVLLIQALLNDPKILILDEPSSFLDPTSRFELFKTLNELKQQGTTIFISTHVLSEVDRYCDSLTLIHDGQIKYNGAKYNSLEQIFYEKVIAN
ncbi:ABC transporter ATP-binding protein [Mycoplasmopsis felifaucium]|uniref:ABC transporter ATP-binding protein n=1 Tax=Mycoplasmopsis felifaucium TaxID=35768 RepID=A0ABZ2RQU9_9BACT|nr:ABC transporter ATP-binding protein [Mycoplasmopsis felifaucium]